MILLKKVTFLFKLFLDSLNLNEYLNTIVESQLKLWNSIHNKETPECDTPGNDSNPLNPHLHSYGNNYHHNESHI